MIARRIPLLALYASDAISVSGNVLTLIAIPWFVLELTGSAALTGLVAFFTALASLVASFLGGTLVDRIGFRRVSVVADLASAVTVAAVPVVHLLWGIQAWQLLILVFLGALLDAPGTAARSSMLPDLAELSGTPLERATSVSQAVRRGAMLVGAPLGGALILLMGTQNVLFLDAASFLVSAVLIGLLTPAIRQHAAAAGEDVAEVPVRGRYIDELLEGLRFLWRDRLARALVLTVMITNFLDAPLLAVIMPVYSFETYGSAVGLGLLIGAFGGAALVGAIGYGIVGPRLPRRLTFGLSFVIVGLPFWVLGASPALPSCAGSVGGHRPGRRPDQPDPLDGHVRTCSARHAWPGDRSADVRRLRRHARRHAARRPDQRAIRRRHGHRVDGRLVPRRDHLDLHQSGDARHGPATAGWRFALIGGRGSQPDLVGC